MSHCRLIRPNNVRRAKFVARVKLISDKDNLSKDILTQKSIFLQDSQDELSIIKKNILALKAKADTMLEIVSPNDICDRQNSTFDLEELEQKVETAMRSSADINHLLMYILVENQNLDVVNDAESE